MIQLLSYLRTLCLVSLVVAACPRQGWAQSADQTDTEVVVVEDNYDPEVIGTGFRTVVNVDAHEGETTSIAEVLASSVGVQVRSLGDLGGFSSISIRGASPSHTAVFVDGVPLSRIASASSDLGAFEFGSFSRIEVFRGSVPVEFGGATLGGAVNLKTQLGPDADGDRVTLSAGLGSFGARHIRGRVKDVAARGRLAYHIGGGYRSTRGDYEYFNDNGTLLVPADDAFVVRENNGFDQLHGVARGRYQWGNSAVEAGARTLWKDQGIPGVASVQATEADLETFSQLADVSLTTKVGGGGDVFANIYTLIERQEYRDLRGQVGLGSQHNRYQTMSLGGSARTAWALGRHRVAAAIDGRVERYSDDNVLVGEAGPTSFRWNTGVSLADSVLVGDRVELVGAVRFDHQYTDPGDGWNLVVADPALLAPRSEQFMSPRLALQVLLGGGVVVKASAGRYFRAPTVIELFGDRGFVVGNPELRAETGVNADVGLVYGLRRKWRGVERALVQLAGFVARPRDAIVLLPGSGQTALAQNLGDATIYGLEAAATVDVWNTLALTANYTFIDSRQRSRFASFDGKRLPLRPQHDVYARADVRWRVFGKRTSLWGDLAYTSGNALDAANMSLIPARLLIGVGAKLALSEQFRLGAEAKNLTDRRVDTIALDPAPRPDLAEVPRAVADFLGYPLPGRAFYVTAESSF